jgi:hypothetical protein
LLSKLRTRFTFARAIGIVYAGVVLATAGPAAATPTFSGPTPFEAGSEPSSIAAADFDLDGKRDLVTANDGSTGVAGVTALRNTTTPGATTPTRAPAVSAV